MTDKTQRIATMSQNVEGAREAKMRDICDNKKEKQMAKKQNPYVIVRTYSAGVFAGTLVSHKGKEVVMTNVRRLWYWAGAASLSQLAVDGTSAPDKCKFPVAMPRVELTEAIEIIFATATAQMSIAAVPTWSA
jgi:hypothetical protein